jgi:hypothetical protein
LMATWGASERVGVMVIREWILEVDRCRAGARRSRFHHHRPNQLNGTVGQRARDCSV